MRRAILRIALGGLVCTLAVLAGGTLLRRIVIGADAAEARQRIEADMRGVFAQMTGELQQVASNAGRPADVAEASRDSDAALERLFASAAAEMNAHLPLDLAITIYAPDGRELAWAGRPADLPLSRRQGPEGWFLAEGDGLRVVYVMPLLAGTERIGAIAAERPLSMTAGDATSRASVDCGAGNAYCFPTRLGPVAIAQRAFESRGGRPGVDTFEVNSPDGALLFTATIRPDAFALTSDRWRNATHSFVLLTLALTMLVAIGPLLDERNRAGRARAVILMTLGAAALVIASRVVMSLAAFADWTDARLFSSATYASFLLPRDAGGNTLFGLLADRLLISPFDFLLTALAVAALAGLLLLAIERWRRDRAGHRFGVDSAGRTLAYAAAQVVAGTLLAALLLVHAAFLRDTIGQTTLDLVQFSEQAWEASRVALELGLVIAHATAVALGVALLRASLVFWRPRREWRIRLLTILGWLLPLMVWEVVVPDSSLQPRLLLAAAGVIVATATIATRLSTRYRHGSQAFRLSLLAVGLVVPSYAFYPAMFYEASRAKVQVVETRYADEVLKQHETLQRQLSEALEEIDGLKDLQEPIEPVKPGNPAIDNKAFFVWQRTALALYPTTSSIELYDEKGDLVSRFAYNLPEDLQTTPRSNEDQCDWLVGGEVSAFFAEERRVLHAGRTICSDEDPRRRLGSIVVHAMVDYENLPFISSRTPYRQLFRPTDRLSADAEVRADSDSSFYGHTSRDVEFVFYGWSFQTLYPTNQPTWGLDADVRERLENDATRTPFWHTLRRGDEEFNVYLLNNRSGIYTLGFPVVTSLGHFVHLAELTELAGCAYLLFLIGDAIFTALGRRAVRAPALLREIRASFYRKLFLAFVAAVILPVGALAIVTHNYVVDEMRANVEQQAIRKASDARRVIEDLVTYFSIPLDDKLMVWVSRLIDQDVNVFEGPRLLATSERALFASGSLPPRAPADVYWDLQLKNETATVTHEHVGTLQDYLVAATPLTTRQPQTMLTVPLTSGQAEIETRIATLNRHLLLGALCFIFGGAMLGYSMAERISDPVNRLSRATQRISRGDLNARIVVRTSDELRRLVEDFNRMAAELQRQHRELQRTHRLEAWAEMARQVAHDIKNPLTPIQLTAEHLRRVHADRGEPMSPILQDCVATILTQVRLLRQIASEFSNFASSPTAKPAETRLDDLLHEILQPYQLGLRERLRFDIDIPPGLPTVYVDRTLVSRALTNIIENALHAMPGEGTLTVVARAGQSVVSVRVTDTGAGMDPEALGRAFEPYFSTKASGTGLGLPIAKRNIELNGGTIAVTSERQRGTSVEITLPVEEVHTPFEPAPA